MGENQGDSAYPKRSSELDLRGLSELTQICLIYRDEELIYVKTKKQKNNKNPYQVKLRLNRNDSHSTVIVFG